MRGLGRLVLVGVCMFAAAGATLFATGAGAGRANESRIATVDVIEILQEMLRTSEYNDPREQTRQTSEEILKAMENEIRRLQGELQLVTPEERARGQQLYNDLQQKQQQYRQVADQRVREFQALSGEQAAEAYAKIYEAAVKIAKDAGYTHVIATRAGATLDEKDTIAMVTQGILARPALLYPEADDLTAKVREALDYEVPAEATEPGAVEPGAAEPTQDGAAPAGGQPAGTGGGGGGRP